MVTIEKDCSNCDHRKSMHCPNSDKCYSKSNKPYWVVKKGIVIEYKPSFFERVVRVFKNLK